MAVAGFGQDDLELVVQENALLVKGKGRQDEDSAKFLHRGIARRAFERRFHLADHIKVVGASLDNGLLHVELVREVPEAAKPRTIAITAGAPAAPQVIEQKAA
jgi:molecular chaperone IbpA